MWCLSFRNKENKTHRKKSVKKAANCGKIEISTQEADYLWQAIQSTYHMNPSIAKKFCKIGYAYMDIKSADKSDKSTDKPDKSADKSNKSADKSDKSADKPEKSSDKSNKSADKHSKSAARQAAYFIHNISNDL